MQPSQHVKKKIQEIYRNFLTNVITLMFTSLEIQSGQRGYVLRFLVLSGPTRAESDDRFRKKIVATRWILVQPWMKPGRLDRSRRRTATGARLTRDSEHAEFTKIHERKKIQENIGCFLNTQATFLNRIHYDMPAASNFSIHR
jgi:hypothetical protein